MIRFARLPDSYWGEAVATAAYIRNRVPTSAFKERVSPYEKWYQRRPDLSHLRVFGCVAYAHIPDCQRNKLDKKAKKCRFVGYSLNYKGYRLMNEKTIKVVISRDVVFSENDFWVNKTEAETIIPTVVNFQVDSDENDTQPNRPVGEIRQSIRQRHPPVRFGTDEYVEAAIVNEVVTPESIEETFAIGVQQLMQSMNP